MARITKGIFGPFSGKIGGVVGSSWRNISYVRAAPAKKKKKKVSGTPAQVANQQKFKYVHEWLIPFHPYLTLGFRNEAKNKTEINAAFSVNYKQAITGVYPDLSVDYAKVQLSKGNLPKLQGVEIRFLDIETIHATWLQNYQSRGMYNDQVMLMVYSPELKMADGITGGTKRAEKQLNFTINAKLKGVPLEVYIAVISLNGKTVSDSQYLGRLEVL